MLAVQQYLQRHSLDELAEELDIRIAYHDSLPLAILNYNQIESPKTHPVVRECRGLVLNTQSYEVVAKGFNRFFNWGEVQDEMGQFDFSDFVVQSKEDGSLVLFYHFDGHWRVNTRGSFADHEIDCQDFTWKEAILHALDLRDLDQLDDWGWSRDCTYVCEFCSLWTKVVRRYDTACVYLLAVFDSKTGKELSLAECDPLAKGIMLRPVVYQFKSIEEIQKFLQEQMSNDPTFEGVVMRDRHGHRWKIKSATYLSLHHLGSVKENLFNPKNLLPFILTGERDELLTYFPEVRDAYEQLEKRVQGWYDQLELTWQETKEIVDQKEFALAVKGRTPFVPFLFDVWKRGLKLEEVWRNSGDFILKVIKNS